MSVFTKVAGLPAAVMAFSLMSFAAVAGETLVVHPKLPAPEIFERIDFGGRKSTAKARVSPEEAENWCENWRPEDKNCPKDLMASEAGKVYEATADCYSGDLVDVHGSHVKYDGLWLDDESAQLAHGRARFKDAVTGKVVHWDNTSGGVVLSMQWMELCPYGAPLDQQPLKTRLDPNSPDDYSGISNWYDHNGSIVHFDYRKGTVFYSSPKESIEKLIPQNSVLFRGTIVPGGPIKGMAFTFKNGCEPAPYVVEGWYGDDDVVLTGKAPVREGCKVVGYTEHSPNAKLVFQVLPY